MIVIELLVLKYREKILKFINKKIILNYVVSSFMGIIPGCIGTFAMDSLYMSGLLGFGGIVAVMIATSGDEAFIMISMALRGEISWALIVALAVLLFGLAIIGGYLADYIKKKTNMRFCTKCKIEYHEEKEFKLKHFFHEHIYLHILKKHIWRIFLWLFAAIFVIELLQDNITLEFTGASIFFVFLIACMVAVLPISGPNIFLIVMFSKGMIPFSVLLANSIIQDGHGLLPIMGFSMDDALRIKLFNFIFGFVVGIILLVIGL
ncbi:arsenic efflux protein [Candidatus Woesearchaeota archaeon]|nr:arsenic efflux protein [Candidatus Woesearchaeota archaeon]